MVSALGEALKALKLAVEGGAVVPVPCVLED